MTRKTKYKFYANIQEFTACCGIGVVSNFEVIDNIDDDDDKYWSWGDFCLPKDISDAQLAAAVKAYRPRGYQLYYMTIPNSTPHYRRLIKAVKKVGWKCKDMVKSNHGNYQVYVFSKSYKRK